MSVSARVYMSSLGGATEWLNSEPLGPAELRGHVVIVNFWTLTCINWPRQEPYVRAWSQAYRDDGLVVIGYWFSDRFALGPVTPSRWCRARCPSSRRWCRTWRGALKCPRHGCSRSRRSSRTRLPGRNPQHAAVAVTEGLLQHLPPDQVKSVLAHEFGHMQLDTPLVVPARCP